LIDSTEARDIGAQCFWRGRTRIITQPTECNCPCEECAPPPITLISPIRPILDAKTPNYDPCADFLRQAAHLKSATQK
jgi:hypothetical protein